MAKHRLAILLLVIPKLWQKEKWGSTSNSLFSTLFPTKILLQSLPNIKLKTACTWYPDTVALPTHPFTTRQRPQCRQSYPKFPSKLICTYHVDTRRKESMIETTCWTSQDYLSSKGLQSAECNTSWSQAHGHFIYTLSYRAGDLNTLHLAHVICVIETHTLYVLHPYVYKKV